MCYTNIVVSKGENAKRTEQLREIRDEVWNLEESPLYEYRKQNNYYPVLGEGSHYAEIMFIGEGPGKNEAETGRPFCGAAGKILDELLDSVSIPREEVYITNILKDRPPGNRDPQPEEIEIYAPFLDRQIKIIKPKIVATLGRFSMKYIMENYGLTGQVSSISKIHGQRFEIEMPYGNILFMPLYHPAVAIYRPQYKKEMEEDFQKLKMLLRGSKN